MLPRNDIRLDRPPRDIHLKRPEAVSEPGPAEAELERLRTEYERGRQDGEKALSEQLVLQRAELHSIQHGVLESLRQAVPRVIQECEASLVALVLEVAQKLVAGLPISASMVEANVREALAHIEQTAGYDIQLHPEDLELLQKAHSALLPGEGKLDKMTIRGSPEVTRGGCLIQTRFGTIDARRETKLAAIKQSLAA